MDSYYRVYSVNLVGLIGGCDMLGVLKLLEYVILLKHPHRAFFFSRGESVLTESL